MGLDQRPRPLRIANIIEEGRWGGPQKRITLVGTALKQHFVETVVFLPRGGSTYFRGELDKTGIAWRALPLHRLGRGWKALSIYALTFFADVFVIWCELRRGHYDAIHVSGGAWQFKGAIAGRIAGKPVIWHLNDTQMPKLLICIFNRLAFLATGFIVTANRVRSYYLEEKKGSNKPIFTVQAPVNIVGYDRDIVIPHEMILQANGLCIVTVANVSPVKGIDTLIKAASLFKQSVAGAAGFNVFIVGKIHDSQSQYSSSLKKLSVSLGLDLDIHFVGLQEDIPGILKACDIFVCSSVAESGPMSVWEAMAMGCAIVSTDVGDVAEYIKNGENGFVVPVSNAEAMADAIAQLANDPELRRQFGQCAREVACQKLDVSVIAEKTASAYLSIIASLRN